jgi:charged multivesicular body protein 4
VAISIRRSKPNSQILDASFRQALKRKKNLENQLAKCDNTITTLEFQAGTIQDAKSNAQVLKVMDQGTKALGQVHKQLDLDKVDDVRDKMQEQHDLANEISDAISSPLDAGGQYVDEDELEDELNQIMQEDFDMKMIDVPETQDISTPAFNTPAVPTTSLPAVPAAAQEDKELEDMEAWLA